MLPLDEPSSGLNPEETEDVAFWIDGIVHDLGVTVLMIEHDMHLVSRASDRLLALNEGHVITKGAPFTATGTGGSAAKTLNTAIESSAPSSKPGKGRPSKK